MKVPSKTKLRVKINSLNCKEFICLWKILYLASIIRAQIQQVNEIRGLLKLSVARKDSEEDQESPGENKKKILINAIVNIHIKILCQNRGKAARASKSREKFIKIRINIYEYL